MKFRLTGAVANSFAVSQMSTKVSHIMAVDATSIPSPTAKKKQKNKTKHRLSWLPDRHNEMVVQPLRNFTCLCDSACNFTLFIYFTYFLSKGEFTQQFYSPSSCSKSVRLLFVFRSLSFCLPQLMMLMNVYMWIKAYIQSVHQIKSSGLFRKFGFLKNIFVFLTNLDQHESGNRIFIFGWTNPLFRTS